jgi:IclR family transcriptional regulator, pca regulon regulatory protein
VSTIAEPTGEFVQSLERGLAVIRCFGAEQPRLSIADVARKANMARAAARRFLLTLEALGYVTQDNGQFALRPRILELGYAYLSSMSVAELAHEHLVRLAQELHESCSASVLDGPDIVYVARAQTSRIMTIALSVGTRLPAHATSMGRVLLAALPESAAIDILSNAELGQLTDRTLTSVDALANELKLVRKQGYAVVDQELEVGIRSVSVPVHDASGTVIAAINISAHASRVSLEEMHDRFLPALQHAATEIERDVHMTS